MHETSKRLYEAAASLGIVGQSNVARALGETPQTLNNWEVRGVSQSGLLKAQNEFQCNANWIATGNGTKEFFRDYMTLQERMKQARIATGLNKSELARQCGVDPSAINHVESGKAKSLSGELLIKISKALSIDPEWLAFGKGVHLQDIPVKNRDPVLDDLDALLPEDADVWRAQIKAAAVKARRSSG